MAFGGQEGYFSLVTIAFGAFELIVPAYHWTDNYYIASSYFSDLITFDEM